MLTTDINGLLENNVGNINSYMPLFEAISNSIHAIKESERKDGEITIHVQRMQMRLDLGEGALPEVDGFIVEDNGIGFNPENFSSFQTVYSRKKINIGGKGFGRFSFLKVFSKVEIESVYELEPSKKQKIEFLFWTDDDGVSAPNIIEQKEEVPNRTLVKLIGKKPDKTFEKKIETIARKIVEHFLLYFSDKTNKHFPTVTIKDPQQGIINLNDYFKDSKDIILHKNHTIECNKNENAKKFTVKIFKVFFSDDANSISLSAHNREVTTTRLDYFVPEFAKHFTEMRGKKETAAQNFIIKAYVLGDYLDDNIYVERNKFNFSKDRDDDALYPFSQREIEREVSDFLRKEFTDLLNERQLNKIRRINQYVDEQEPWYRNILDRLDLSAIPETISDKELGTELHSRKSALELNVKKEASEILASETIEDADKVNQIVEKITDIGKSDLTHYIANRKVILEIFEKSLKWDEKGKYQPEDVIHNIIFPMKHNSDSLPYDKNNLWIIDERLNFNTYMASDKKLASGIQPDLLMFDKPVAMREGYEPTNPVTIFEFKKPQKKGYKLHDEQRTNDPIKQIADYADDIRAGKVKTPEGREIKVDPNTTPFYGLVICDFNESARSLFRGYALTRSSDGESYYGFHSEYRIYFEVMSFDKLLKDAKLRNRIFFKKLGIE